MTSWRQKTNKKKSVLRICYGYDGAVLGDGHTDPEEEGKPQDSSPHDNIRASTGAKDGPEDEDGSQKTHIWGEKT